MTQDQIFSCLADKMSELFEIDRSAIKPESTFEEFELTSIDAIDLVVELQKLAGRRISEASFRNVRTVGDLVAAIGRHLAPEAKPTLDPAS